MLSRKSLRVGFDGDIALFRDGVCVGVGAGLGWRTGNGKCNDRSRFPSGMTNKKGNGNDNDSSNGKYRDSSLRSE
jgi:hypothetical protein